MVLWPSRDTTGKVLDKTVSARVSFQFNDLLQRYLASPIDPKLSIRAEGTYDTNIPRSARRPASSRTPAHQAVANRNRPGPRSGHAGYGLGKVLRRQRARSQRVRAGIRGLQRFQP